MSEYTPGPWKAVPRGMSDEHDVIAEGAPYGGDLSGQRGMFAKGADARLAAAAPDLLKAAKEAFALLEDVLDPDDRNVADELFEADGKLGRAIRKAEGGGE